MLKLHRLNFIQILLNQFEFAAQTIMNWMIMQSVGHDKCISSSKYSRSYSMVDWMDRKKEMPCAVRTLTAKTTIPSPPLVMDSRRTIRFIYDEIWKAKINCGRFIFALNDLLIPPNEAVST